MAKNIHMQDPFDVLTGNLGSKQDLRYREHNNKAYEAPDGVAPAKNYHTRYIGVRKADGTVYFMVKKKSTSKLSSKTRMTMAILGSIAAIKSAEKTGHSADWANLHSIYIYRMAHGGDEAGSGISFDKWLGYWLRRMLRYKMGSINLSGSGLSVTILNPYTSFDDDALAISSKTFKKFVFAMTVDPSVVEIKVDGQSFPAVAATKWNVFKGADMTNANYVNTYTGFDVPSSDDAPVTYNNLQLYTSAGVAVKSDDNIIANEAYTTIAPSA